jgi:hypothetical protein
MARKDIINSDGSLNYDTIGGFKDRLDGVDKVINKPKSTLLDLAKYGIVTTPMGSDFEPTTPNYLKAYANGVNIQNAINDAKAAGIAELIFPPGNYPLCYHASGPDSATYVINATGINLRGYGARLYVLYDDLDTGLNPYYTGDPLAYHGMTGGVMLVDSDVLGFEIVGERGARRHPNSKWRDTSFGIGPTTGSKGNLIKDCKIHHFSGDGIYGMLALPGAYISNAMNCQLGNMSNGVPIASTDSWISSRMGIGYSVDPTKPVIVCSTGYSYVIYTAKPMKICCFDKTQTWVGDVIVNQGEFFVVPPTTFYVYVVTYQGGKLTASTNSNVTFRFGNGYYYNTTFDNCDIYGNTRGGISNPPSGSVVKNCVIHDNGGAYEGMMPYYDGTQFGIDVEDWYIHRITIENCNFYGQINDILFRCRELIVKNTVTRGIVSCLDFVSDVHFEFCKFLGGVGLTGASSWGVRTAIGCTIGGVKPPELEVVSNLNQPVTTTMEASTGMVTFLNSLGLPLFQMDLSKFKPDLITPYITQDILLDIDFTGRASAGVVTFDDTQGKATVTTASGACVAGGLSVVAAGVNMATVTWKTTPTLNQELTFEAFGIGFPQHIAETSGTRDIMGSAFGYGNDITTGTLTNNSFVNPIQSGMPYTNTSSGTSYPTGYAGNSVYHDDGTTGTASESGTPGIKVIKYTHIVMIFKADGTIQTWINGYLITTASVTTAFQSWNYSTITSSLKLWRESSVATGEVLKAFRMYNRALSKTEIRYNRDYGINHYGIVLS